MMTLTPTYATGSNASSSTAAATPAPPPAAPAQYSVPPQSPGVSLVPSPSSYPSPPAVVDQKADAAKVEGAVASSALQSAAISGAISAVTGGSWRSAAIRGGLSAGAFALIRARRKRLSEERAKSGIVTSEGLGIDPSNPYDVTADELAYVEAYYDDNEAPAMMMNAPIQPQGSRLYCTPAKAVPPTASPPPGGERSVHLGDVFDVDAAALHTLAVLAALRVCPDRSHESHVVHSAAEPCDHARDVRRGAAWSALRFCGALTLLHRCVEQRLHLFAVVSGHAPSALDPARGQEIFTHVHHDIQKRVAHRQQRRGPNPNPARGAPPPAPAAPLNRPYARA